MSRASRKQARRANSWGQWLGHLERADELVAECAQGVSPEFLRAWRRSVQISELQASITYYGFKGEDRRRLQKVANTFEMLPLGLRNSKCSVHRHWWDWRRPRYV